MMYNITIRQIDLFLAAAANKSFTAAARQKYVTQPAISKCIRSMEEELGVPLFVRGAGKTELTPEGEYLAASWQGLLVDFFKDVEEVRAIRGQRQTELHIGWLNRVSDSGDIRRLLDICAEADPQVQVSISVLSYRELLEDLLAGKNDLIFTLDFSLDDRHDVDWIPVIRWPVYIAIGADHPLAARDQLHLRDLANETFYQIDPREARQAGERMTRVCRRAGFAPRVRYVPNTPSLAMAIQHSGGVTICGREVCEFGGPPIRLYESPEELADQPKIALAWKRGHISAAGQQFVSRVRSAVAEGLVGKD